MVPTPSTPPQVFLQGKTASSAPSLTPLPAHVCILSVQVLNFHLVPGILQLMAGLTVATASLESGRSYPWLQ